MTKVKADLSRKGQKREQRRAPTSGQGAKCNVGCCKREHTGVNPTTDATDELSLTHRERAKVKVGLGPLVPADTEVNRSPPRGAKDKQQRTNTPAMATEIYLNGKSRQEQELVQAPRSVRSLGERGDW